MSKKQDTIMLLETIVESKNSMKMLIKLGMPEGKAYEPVIQAKDTDEPGIAHPDKRT